MEYGSSTHAASAESYEFLCSTIDQAELVPRRVAHIGGVHAHAAALAPAGGVFDLGAAVGQGCCHCGIYLLGGDRRQPQRKAVVVGGRLPVARMRHHQPHAVVCQVPDDYQISPTVLTVYGKNLTFRGFLLQYTMRGV